jgi:hypothetical protein
MTHSKRPGATVVVVVAVAVVVVVVVVVVCVHISSRWLLFKRSYP